MSDLTPRRVRFGRIVAPLLLAVMVFCGMRPFYPGFLVAARADWGRYLDDLWDRRAPGYRELLGEADRIVPAGSRVTVLFPTLDWDRGYSYAYYRAHYVLAGRVVFPLSERDRSPRPERLGDADYAIVYRSELPRDGWETLYRSAAGSVARRAP